MTNSFFNFSRNDFIKVAGCNKFLIQSFTSIWFFASRLNKIKSYKQTIFMETEKY